MPLPPAVGRAVDRAIGDRTAGPILLNLRGTRMDRHARDPQAQHRHPSYILAAYMASGT
ncbi:hypothetical protein [Micromonospora sp. DT47]|uniref:hypothetical protein n=1 Tax=Micromonospora sp. DT47 TaxID=3393431 RepID=UPI003CF5B496